MLVADGVGTGACALEGLKQTELLLCGAEESVEGIHKEGPAHSLHHLRKLPVFFLFSIQ